MGRLMPTAQGKESADESEPMEIIYWCEQFKKVADECL